MSIFGSLTTAFGGARSAATVSTSGTVDTSVGDLIIVGVGWSDSGTCTGVTDTAGNSFTPGTKHNGAGGSFFQWFYCLAATGADASNGATASFSNPSNNNTIISLRDVVLTGGTAAFDVDVPSDGGSDHTTAVYSTAGSDEFVAVDAYDQAGGGGYAAQISPAYTLDSASYGTFGGAEHIVFSSTQSSITSGFSAGSSSSAAFALGIQASGGSPGAIVCGMLGAGALSANTGNFNLVAAMAGSGSLTGLVKGKGALAAILAGSGSMTAAGIPLSNVSSSFLGTSTLTGILKGVGTIAANLAGEGSLEATISTPYALTSAMMGRGSLVAFPTIPPLRVYFPPNNPGGKQSPPYIIKDFGASIQRPAYVSTSGTSLQLFYQPTFLPNVNAGSSLPPQWSTPGTPDNQGYQGRVQAPGQLLVGPDNLRLSGKIYKIVAQGMIYVPSSAVNPTFSLQMFQNYFAFGQAPIADSLFSGTPIPLNPGTMNGFTLIATLAGNGVSSGVLSSAGILWVGGQQYFGNGFSNRLVGHEPIIQLSLGIQFNGAVTDSENYQAFLSKFIIYNSLF